MPVIGGLARKIAVARFARTLSTMLASGVQLLQALDIVRSLLGNVVLEKVADPGARRHPRRRRHAPWRSSAADSSRRS